MPPFQQPSTQMISPLKAGTVAGSPEYNQYMVDRYAADTTPAFKQNMRAGRSYMRSSRGLTDSGLEGAYAAGNVQQRNTDINRYAADLGQQSAGNAYQDQVRKQAHDWMIEDEKRRLDEAHSMQDKMRAMQQQQNQDQLWGNILKSAGTLVGTYYGGPAGGAAVNTGMDAMMPAEPLDENGLPYLD